ITQAIFKGPSAGETGKAASRLVDGNGCYLQRRIRVCQQGIRRLEQAARNVSAPLQIRRRRAERGLWVCKDIPGDNAGGGDGAWRLHDSLWRFAQRAGGAAS